MKRGYELPQINEIEFPTQSYLFIATSIRQQCSVVVDGSFVHFFVNFSLLHLGGPYVNMLW